MSVVLAVAALARGAPVVVPTDTVYGVAATPGHAGALFGLKERPVAKALPILGAGTEQLSTVAVFDERASALASAFWPGPVTLVLARAGTFTADLGGLDPETVAVRVPAHDVALEVLRATGPLAVTSANLSGGPPATTLAEARRVFGDRVEVYLDGGVCDGTPSTVVSLTGAAEILREGGPEAEAVLAMLRMPRTAS